MCSNEYLRYVTNGCMQMTYDPRDRRPESPKAEPRTRIAAPIRRFTPCCRTVGGGLWRFSSPGLSLSAAGPALKRTGARWRYESGFHRQTLPRIGSAPADVRQAQRFVVERNRQPNLARGLAAEKKAWLSKQLSAAMRFTGNIVLIGCSLKNWSKLTNFSCPRSVDRSERST